MGDFFYFLKKGFASEWGIYFVAQAFAKGFYKSKQWKDTRSSYAASVGHLCEVCLRKGLYSPGEIVHHKEKLTSDNINDPLVSLSWDNLELLCRDCHGKAHGAVKRYQVDAMGRITTR